MRNKDIEKWEKRRDVTKKDVEKVEKKIEKWRKINAKQPNFISTGSGCFIIIAILFIAFFGLGELAFQKRKANAPKYEIVDAIKIKNHLFVYNKIYYNRSNQTNAYVLILIPDDYESIYPQEFSHIKHKDSLKYNSVMNTLKQFKYFSDNDLRQIKTWLENKRVFTENTDPNALQVEEIDTYRLVRTLNEERKNNASFEILNQIRETNRRIKSLLGK